MSATAHAKQFLAPLDGARSFSTLAASLIGTAKKDPAVAKLFIAVQEALGDGKDLVTARQAATLDKAIAGVNFDLPSAPDWVRPAVLAAYLNARNRLTEKAAKTILASPERALKRALAASNGLEPGFVGQLILEAARVAKKNPVVAKQLGDAAQEFAPIVKKLYKPPPAKLIAKAANTNSGGGCSICRGGSCSPISCWVIVVVIIVIIVTK